MILSNKIITVHHKNDVMIEIFKKYFNPVQVGCYINCTDLGIERDDGHIENIAQKNNGYCELTALYYLWKTNISNSSDYVGLMHYRRIFSTKIPIKVTIKEHCKYILKSAYHGFFGGGCDVSKYNVENIYNINSFENKSKLIDSYIKDNDFDFILPKPIVFRFLNIKQQYEICHDKSVNDLFHTIVVDKFPELRDSIKIVNDGNKLYPYNMFVMKSEYLNEYCHMLFSCLFELESEINIEHYDFYQKRLYGFLGERFLNYYINYISNSKEVVIKELPVAFLDV